MVYDFAFKEYQYHLLSCGNNHKNKYTEINFSAILKLLHQLKKGSWENAVILGFLVTPPGSWKITFEKFCWRKSLHLFL